MSRGPLPSGTARRRNTATIPTTNLPASGRRTADGKKVAAPRPPKGYDLGAAGKLFWRWAWALPQSAAWDDGSHYALARRAQLEDHLAALGEIRGLDLSFLDGMEDDVDYGAIARAITAVIGTLQAKAGGASSLMKEMRELDNRFGLNPKAMADLRWQIVPDDETLPADTPKAPSNVRRLRPRDPASATG